MGGPSFNTADSAGAVVWEGKISTCLEELRSQTTPMSFCKRINLFVPQRVASSREDVQDTWSFSRFSIKYHFTSLQHKGDPEEKQTTPSSISKWCFSTHISRGIKIALNPGLSKLLRIGKPASSGQWRHNWDTTTRPYFQWILRSPGIILCAQEGTYWHWNADSKEQSKHEQGAVWKEGVGVYFSFPRFSLKIRLSSFSRLNGSFANKNTSTRKDENLFCISQQHIRKG